MTAVRFDAWLIRPLPQCAPDFLSTDETTRAARFARQEDRDVFVSSRVALRCLLADVAKVHPGALRFVANAWGRPVLDPPLPSVDFNVSHTVGLGVIVLAHGARIGVDLERVRVVTDRDRIAADVFEAAVVRRLSAVPEDARDALFLRLWTAGEALVKATGIGLGGQGMPVPVALSDGGTPALRPDHGRGTWTLVPLTVPAGYVGALAVEATLAPGTRCAPRPIDLAQLVACFRR